MQCRTCGRPLPQGAAVCPNCGAATPYNVEASSGSYEPTVQATPFPRDQGAPPPPTSYGSPPPPAYGGGAPTPPPYGGTPTPPPYGGSGPSYQPYQQNQGSGYQVPPPYQPVPGQQPYQPVPGQQPYQPVPPPRKSRVGLIIGIVAGVLLLSCVGIIVLTAAFANKSGSSTTTSTGTRGTVVATATPEGATPTVEATPTSDTTKTGGSGTPISPEASQIINGVKTATGADATTAEPTGPTSTFKTYDTVYITFTLDTNKHDFEKEPGYVEVKLYGGSTYIGKKSLKIDRAAPGGYFTAVYYKATTGYAELYWCKQESCSDEALGQVGTFTITG